MKKFLILIGIFAFIISSSILVVNAQKPAVDKKFQKMGLIQKQNEKNTDVYAKGKNVIVYKNEVKEIMEFCELTSQKISEEEAFKKVATRRVLLHKAKDNSYTATQKKVDRQI